MTHDANQPNTATAVRTLLAAGFEISRTNRQPGHIEIECSRTDILGTKVPYVIAITEGSSFSDDQVQAVARAAIQRTALPVRIASQPGEAWISWNDFTEALGGAVPTWLALEPAYDSDLLVASRNALPVGYDGEAWLVFEDLVAAGIEFLFGRRARRLGGRTRGRAVSDIQALTPQERVVVIDCKASRDGFDAAWANLRALQEYVERQKQRQRGQFEVRSALVVSSSFAQDDATLSNYLRNTLRISLAS